MTLPAPADSPPRREGEVPGRLASTGERRRRAAWLAAGLAALLLFFAPALSPQRQFGYFDNGRMHVPMKRYIAEELSAGRLPAWNPYAGLGAPLVADPVNGTQHPFNLLVVLLPFDAGFKLWVLLLFPIAGLGAWAWARRVGLGDPPAAVAGLLFSLSGYTVSETGNMQYLGALAFFPWILAAAAAFVERPSPWRAALAVSASALCAASGDPQGWAIAVAAGAVAAVTFAPGEVSRRRAAVRSAGAVGAAIMGALPFVAPTLAWVPHSGRAEAFDAFEYEHFNLLPPRILEFAVPHLFRTSGREVASELYEAYAGSALHPFPWALSVYVGASAVALAVLGAVRGRSARLLLVAAAAFGWMAMGANAGFGQLARRLPLLGNLRYWEKLATWPSLLVAVAAAFGLEALLSSGPLARRFGAVAAAVGATALALGIVAGAFPDRVAALVAPASGSVVAASGMAENLREGLLHLGAFMLALGAAARLLVTRTPGAAAACIAAIVVADVGAANLRAYVLYDAESTHPPSPLAAELHRADGLPRLLTPFRPYTDDARFTADMEDTWRWGARNLHSAWNVPERVANFETYSGMLPVRTNRFWRRVPTRGLPHVAMWGYDWVYSPPGSEATIAKLVPGARERRPLPGGGALVRLPARPRAYLAAEVASVDRRGAMEFVLDARSATGPRSVVEGPVPADHGAPSGAVRIVEDAPDKVVVAAEADRPALLVLNDTFAVGWEAELDGASAEILPANYLARGVWIGPGRHEVRFTYRTPWLREAWGFAVAGLLALVAWALRARRAERESASAGRPP